MSARRLTDTHVIIATAVLTVLLGTAAAFIQPPRQSGSTGASSFSAAPDGAKAAFLTLARLDYAIERSYEPMTAISADPSRTTIVVTGSIPASEQDRRALESFLDRGGRVLLVGVQGADLLRLTGSGPSNTFARPTRHRALLPSALARNATDITMVPMSRAPAFGPSYVRVFTVAGDQPLVATARSGAGRVIWFASATPMANAHIGDASNLQLLLNAVGSPRERKILWDEHYHGHTRSLWSYVVRTPLPLVGAQAGVMAIALFAGYSRRSGPVRARAADARTSPLEFINMLRALYERAEAAGAAVAAARRRLQRVAASTCGVPIDSAVDVFAKAISARSGVKAEQVLDTLASSQRAERDSGLKAAEALKLTQELQRLTAALTRPTH